MLPVTTVQTVTAVHLAISDLSYAATMDGRVLTIAYSGPAGRHAQPRHRGIRVGTDKTLMSSYQDVELSPAGRHTPQLHVVPDWSNHRSF